VCAFLIQHASNTHHPPTSFDGFGKSTHETPRYEIFSGPLSTPHILKHSFQYPACMALSTRINSLSALFIVSAGGEVQGGGRISCNVVGASLARWWAHLLQCGGRISCNVVGASLAMWWAHLLQGGGRISCKVVGASLHNLEILI
jgi:hypothetical protein